MKRHLGGMTVFTPFHSQKLPFKLQSAHAPTGLLPILLARRRQHSHDQQHRRDEWVSGNMGLRPKLGRASGSSTQRCVALRCAGDGRCRCRLRRVRSYQANPRPLAESVPQEELPGIGRGWASPFCHVRPAFPGKGGLTEKSIHGGVRHGKKSMVPNICKVKDGIWNTLERV